MLQKRIIVYCRVSSGSQDLREQIDAAKKYLKARNIDEKEVHFLQDFNVSATKNDIANRPAFHRLIQWIREGKVGTIILYSRDRAYRDFYEAAYFNELMIQHDVEVIYTATGAIPFLKDSRLESIYGIFAQQEGENIRRRIADAVKRYPGKIIGYHRHVEKTNQGKGKVYFTKDHHRSDLIASLFEECSQIQSDEEFITILKTFGKELGGHDTVVKILQRPFYAAHCLTEHGYDKLEHVEPVITLDLFKKVQVILDHFIEQYEKIVQRHRNIWIKPVCGYCNKEMTFRNTLDTPAHFVCSNRHQRLIIEWEELNHMIESTMMKEIKKFTMSAYGPIFRDHFNKVLNKLDHQKKHKEQLLERHTLSLASDPFFRNRAKRNHFLSEMENIRAEIETIDQDQRRLRALNGEVEMISKIVDPAINKFTLTELKTLVELLIKKVEVYHEHLEFDMYRLVFDQTGVGSHA